MTADHARRFNPRLAAYDAAACAWSRASERTCCPCWSPEGDWIRVNAVGAVEACDPYDREADVCVCGCHEAVVTALVELTDAERVERPERLHPNRLEATDGDRYIDAG